MQQHYFTKQTFPSILRLCSSNKYKKKNRNLDSFIPFTDLYRLIQLKALIIQMHWQLFQLTISTCSHAGVLSFLKSSFFFKFQGFVFLWHHSALWPSFKSCQSQLSITRKMKEINSFFNFVCIKSCDFWVFGLNRVFCIRFFMTPIIKI